MPGYFIKQAVPIGSRLKVRVQPVNVDAENPYTARAWIVDPQDGVRNYTKAQLASTVTIALGDGGSVWDGTVEIGFAGEAKVSLAIWVERADGTTYSKRLEREVSGPSADVWLVYCRVRSAS